MRILGRDAMKLFLRIMFKIFLILTILAGNTTTEEIKGTDSDELLNQGIALLERYRYPTVINSYCDIVFIPQV
jgi:hypothetical protein